MNYKRTQITKRNQENAEYHSAFSNEQNENINRDIIIKKNQRETRLKSIVIELKNVARIIQQLALSIRGKNRQTKTSI